MSSSAAGEVDSTSGVGKEAKKASTKIETWRKFGITAPLLAAEMDQNGPKSARNSIGFFFYETRCMMIDDVGPPCGLPPS